VAGVAHEINNPVGFIHGNLAHVQEYTRNLLDFLQLYQQHYPHPVDEIQAEAEEIDLEFIQDDLPKMLSSMQIGTERIRNIVLSLRNFSRTDEVDIKPVNIHEGIDSTLMILQHRLKARSERPEIQVLKNYGSLPLIECYAGPLNQVFMNILSNAIDALEENNARRKYQEIKENPSQITIGTSVIDAQWVEIAIADNGSGIPKEIRQRIFDPFFTTKPVGKGTGMGMSISYQIVTEKHGGKLECFSTLGEGTEFAIKIPVRQNLCHAS
jgi:signal transduction histidine kinase